MRAALIYGPRDLRVVTVDTPSLQQDEVLVRVYACGVCGTDVHTYRTGKDPAGEMPVLAGHEFSGEVVEVGGEVEGVTVGDRVVGTGFRPCGECYWCQQGRYDRCPSPRVPGSGLDGAFAEYVVVPQPVMGRMFFHIPDGMDWDEAATIEPLSVACFDVRRARIRPDETVVVLGAGMIGQCVAQVCKAQGASRVIVSEPNAARRQMAGSLGADAVVDPLETDLAAFVQDITSGEMAGVVFECAGSPVAFQQIPLVLRPFGRIMQVAVYEEGLNLLPDVIYRMFQMGNFTWQGCGGQRWDMAVDLVANGKVKTGRLVTYKFPLESAREAFETQLASPEAIKVLVKP